jgi:transcriptional regulator GlxA family with amidase domain
MNVRRKELLGIGAAALAAMAARPLAARAQAVPIRPLTPPKGRAINVAFVAGKRSNLIDIAGPAEVFQDTWVGTFAQTMAGQRGPYLIGPHMPFAVYMVADAIESVAAGPQMTFLPHYTLTDAPAPDVVVVGAQSTPSAAKLDWLRRHATTADVTMSVCTGAFVLGAAGLLNGLRATTHHAFYDDLAKTYPQVQVVRGARFVEDGRIASAGGLTCGIDLALHIVARYFGQTAADNTANWMEYTPMTARPSTLPT